MRILILALALFTLPAFAEPASAIDPGKIATFDKAAFSQEVTACDQLAAHPDDPDRVSLGVGQSAVDLPAAIAACTAAVAADPENPRLNYQLGRVYGYAGRGPEGEASRMKAVMAGYPQSLFVVGYIMVTGWSGNPKNPCLGGELIRRSALAGRKAGLVGFPHYVVNGVFKECAVVQDKAELQSFLERAKPQIKGFYEEMMLTDLTARVAAWKQPKAKRKR
jgi:hypothetical protein